ncbi:MAG: TerC family protein [Gemmatimonadaceae bacterium]
MTTIWPWIAFNAAVLALLAVDLGLFNRKSHVVSVRQAATWSIVWVTLALAFAASIFYFRGHRVGIEFITGYLIEYSLSVDNIFVMVLIFSYFGIRDEYQHRVLFWGILGALVMRGVMIGLGAALITRFQWITYIFGAFLVITGVRMAFKGEQEIDPGANPVLRLMRRIVPVCGEYDGEKFFIRTSGATSGPSAPRGWMATPLFVVLVVIETMDLVFAVDSIPAVFAVTREPFIVYSSNVAAILGLRSLYFLLSGAVQKFRYLSYGLAVVLSFVGLKMLIAGWYHIPTLASLGVIVLALATAAVASVIVVRREEAASASSGGGPPHVP